MRIIGGRLKGRPIAGPPAGSDEIRPTSDRLRESLFNVLAHAYGDPAPGARVLDLFAGTGALGLESLSRGAAFALLVDEGAGARALMRANLDALGLGGQARILRRDATRLGPIGAVAPCALAFCDPPYGRALAAPALASAREGGWLAPGALVIAETEAAGNALAAPEGFEMLEARDYGETRVSVLRVV